MCMGPSYTSHDPAQWSQWQRDPTWEAIRRWEHCQLGLAHSL